MNMQNIQNVSDLAQLYNPLSLYLKPLAKFTISVALPSNVTGKSISNFEVMDKLRQMILPDKFLILKVSKSTIESLKFEAELDDRTKLKNVITRLDGRQIKLTGFTEYIKLRALESKDEFPTRHDWDSFFRDAKNMDEMKAGERPDTIYLSNLPIKWFCPRHQENENGIKPSENLFKRIFEKYGDVRCVDIPICDIYRPQMKSHMTGLKTFSFDNETYFEGYVQFSEYGAFVRAMDEFRGMKLVRKEEDKNVAVNIQVTFDKTKHLSDSSVKRRKVIRDRFIEKDRLKEEDEEKRLKEIEDNKEKERKLQEANKQAELDKQRQREEKRKKKYMEKINQSESSELTKKIRNEQKKLLKTQRKMESVRILEALFERIKMKYPAEAGASSSKSFQQTDLRKKLEGKHKNSKEPMIDLKSIKKERSLSITSISSNDSCLSDSNINKTSMKKKTKKKQRSNSPSSSTSSSSNSSSSSSNSSSSNAQKRQQMIHPGAAPGMFPGWMNNPETGEWYAAPGMYPGMYPFMMPGMMPPVRAPYYQNPNYRGSRGNYNPRYQRGSRGGYRGRGRGNYHSYDVDQRHYKSRNDDDEYYNEHESRDGRRSYSRSPRSRRSYSRSRSRRRSYSRSRSRSRSRSSRSRSKASNSHSRSRKSRSRKRSSSKNRLVSTLRDADTKKAPPTTQRHKSNSKSRSRSRHSSASGWSSPGYRKSGKSGKSKRSWSKESDNNRSHPITLTPEKMLKSAREIQIHVQKKLQEQHDVQEKRKKQQERDENDKNEKGNGLYLKRSASVESDKFKSPNRVQGTPEMNIA